MDDETKGQIEGIKRQAEIRSQARAKALADYKEKSDSEITGLRDRLKNLNNQFRTTGKIEQSDMDGYSSLHQQTQDQLQTLFEDAMKFSTGK